MKNKTNPTLPHVISLNPFTSSFVVLISSCRSSFYFSCLFISFILLFSYPSLNYKWLMFSFISIVSSHIILFQSHLSFIMIFRMLFIYHHSLFLSLVRLTIIYFWFHLSSLILVCLSFISIYFISILSDLGHLNLKFGDINIYFQPVIYYSAFRYLFSCSDSILFSTLNIIFNSFMLSNQAFTYYFQH